MDWSKLAAARTILLTLLGFALVTVGAFSSPWPWIGWIVGGALLVLLAYLTDAPVRR